MKGVYRWLLKCTVTPYQTVIVAANVESVWRKFVAQKYRDSPLKPNREDFTITNLGEAH